MSTAPGRCPAPADDRLPTGFQVELARDTRVSRNGRLLFGGSPPRLLRLSAVAAGLIRDGRVTVRDTRSARLARALVDSGAAHPRPAAGPAGSVAIIIPVRDRPGMLARLLSALCADPGTAGVPVVVVDDGSRVPEATRATCDEYGAKLVRHETSRGPAAARNSGLRATTSEFVAFCDSDVVPEPGWLPPLLMQFTDPGVGLAAPRIVALPARDRIGRFEELNSPLDLGGHEALIVPMTRVAYVPSAALVLRRAAAPRGFSEQMRVAEDVDLCLRLHEAGWRCRYLPASQVAHDHRTDLVRWLAQRAFYGSGAAPLSLRHPGQVPPVHVSLWSLLAATLVLTGRRWALATACGITVATAVRVRNRMPDADSPTRAAVLLTLAGLWSTALQLLHAAVRHHWPVALGAMLVNRRLRQLILAASTAEALVDRYRSGSALGPVTFVALRRLDDLAYGAGVWWGALRHRTLSPLLPRISGVEGGRRIARLKAWSASRHTTRLYKTRGRSDRGS
ncbi:mycofactocin biosynthesis glycosyltransferase MftF [Allosalinactinospora lopnorensis]|uniref:mycofactocin biosynthesis glycosyltransferase MftF n=1 Tax=Allosalinactinospora lopnorensis TaxID=1352348 RepID=UPI0009E4180E|nr:mycofactocin biosynthesis glycosyltransferase MftF [Allosalinactinospora lopnorensis]